MCSRSRGPVIPITFTRSQEEYFSPNLSERSKVADAVYSVFRLLGNGEFLHVASRDELEDAVQLVKAFNAHWPGEYIVRDSEGKDVDLSEYK